MKSGPYQLSEIAAIFGISEEEVVSRYCILAGKRVVVTCGYYLQDRAVHVFTEAQRVVDFHETCLATSFDDDGKLKKLGELMNESHTSCDKHVSIYIYTHM